MKINRYFVFNNGRFDLISLKEIEKLDEQIWSARLSTGLLGLTSCLSGNRGPKSIGEIILSVGDEGLIKLIDLGFITCPACHPEKTDRFWEVTQRKVIKKYCLNTLEDFTNKSKLPFDARRVLWEEILPIIKILPGRIYLPKGLSNEEIIELNKRFIQIGFKLPPVGYYNPEVPGRFSKYQIPSL
jgi:hypothetical protein